MLRIGWRWLTIVTLATWLLPAAAAGNDASTAEPTDARAWLSRIHAAAKQRNYQGTMVFSTSGMLSSSRVAHFCIGEQSYERLEALDGRQQRVYRLNDAIHTMWPQTRVAVIEKRTPITGLPSTTQAIEPRALEFYDFIKEGGERVAGRDAQVFLLRPRDGLRYAQRLWADKATGLMLRADVIGAAGVLESAAFSEVQINVPPHPESVTHEIRRIEGWKVLRPQQDYTQLENEGWSLARVVPGFKMVGCVKRPLDSDTNASAQVLQAVYSDGLTHVSLFIEPFEPRRPMEDLSGQIGATSTLRLRRGEHWVTVMGDVPAPTLKAFADALERRR